MDALAPGDIVAVPFPYSDRLAEKRRPALILTRIEGAGGATLYWAAMVTSSRRTAWPGDLTLPAGDATGLPVDSVLRPAKLATLEPERIARKAGAAPAATLAACLDWARTPLGGD